MVIINADDFGRSNSINKAVKECFMNGIISQATIMANMPAYDEAVEISKKYNFYNKIGLHITLDEGEPLSNKIKNNPHFCKDGFFIKNCIHGIMKIHINKYDRECIEEEVEAQMKKYVDSGFPLMHIDSHHHIHINISVMRVVKRVAKKYGFRSVRISPLRPSDSFLKRLYKLALNKYIQSSFITTKKFEVSRDTTFSKSDSVEIMTHPDIINGNLVEVIKREPLQVKRYL